MKKKLVAVAVVIVLIAVIASAILYFSADFQMRKMSDLVLNQVKEYNFEQIIGEDPVKEFLMDIFGEERPISRELFYNYLKQNAKSMTWEIDSTSRAEKKADMSISYIDISPFAECYADGIGKLIAEKVVAGEIAIADEQEIFQTISDEENASVIKAAIEMAAVSDSSTVYASVKFETKCGIYIPTDVSEGIYDAASSGLYSQAEEIPLLVKKSVISNIVECMFELIREFDIEAMERLSGYDISLVEEIGSETELGREILVLLKNCAAKIDYTIESPESELPIVLRVSYCDASEIAGSFLTNLIKYAASSLFGNQIELSGDEILRRTINQAGELPIIDSEISIGLNQETGKPEITGDVANILSANLLGSLSALTSLMQ